MVPCPPELRLRCVGLLRLWRRSRGGTIRGAVIFVATPPAPMTPALVFSVVVVSPPRAPLSLPFRPAPGPLSGPVLGVLVVVVPLLVQQERNQRTQHLDDRAGQAHCALEVVVRTIRARKQRRR